MKITRRLLIKGRVQGVGFRVSLYYAATRFSLAGWVRNLQDGSVEAVAQGSEKNLEEFIAWAHKGPGMARVDSVEISDASGDFSGFLIRDTE